MFVLENILQTMAYLFIVAVPVTVAGRMFWGPPHPDEPRRWARLAERIIFIFWPCMAAFGLGVLIFSFYYAGAVAFLAGDGNKAMVAGMFLGFSVLAWFLLMWWPLSKLVSGLGQLAYARVRSEHKRG